MDTFMMFGGALPGLFFKFGKVVKVLTRRFSCDSCIVNDFQFSPEE